ncbi:uncharacterized protein METZ01_LOCUS152417, partial [marine metagenome]
VASLYFSEAEKSHYTIVIYLLSTDKEFNSSLI